MDRVVALIVRAFAAFAKRAHVLPGFVVNRYVPGEKIKVLLVGYNGTRNTGSDVRVAALTDQIIQALGRDNVEVSVITANPESTEPYFIGKAHQVLLSTIFFLHLLRACSQNHVIVLCEGSTFKSKFADALTLYTCEAAGVARAQGKPCIAYGGEIGQMEPYLGQTVQDLCSDVFFMARSEGSYRAAQDLGLKAYKGTDTAWSFDSSRGHEEAMRLLREGGWDGEKPLLGIAPVNPYWWPVKPSLRKWIATALGSKKYPQFEKWYFFSWTPEREALFRQYLDDMATAAAFAREHGFTPVILGMEKLDEDACMQLAEKLDCDVPTFLSRDQDGFVMSEVLRSCSLLVTSRYHAQVLATQSNVPTVAVSMDERLDNLAHELATPEELLLHVGQQDLAEQLLASLEYALDNRGEISELLAERRTHLEELLQGMSEQFILHLEANGIATPEMQSSLCADN